MDDEAPIPAPTKPSRTPSWVMMGFVLGALFILALPRRAPEKPAAALEPAPPATVKFVPAPRFTTIEAVFAQWGASAVWSNDTTEVALWNSETKAFSDCFEVMRFGDACYFRSIPRLTRPVLAHGVKAGSPLQFTETELQRQEWLRAGDEENWSSLRDSAKTR